ncbi:reverse transcriptase domain-containing protein [Tanacetum coccineum]
MRTRSSSNFVGEPSTNPPSTSTNTKRHNRRRSKQRVEPFSLEESPVVTIADQRTMAELLCAPTEGYAKAIVVPPILAEHFELKHIGGNVLEKNQLTHAVNQQTSDVTTAMTAILKQFQATPPPASVKSRLRMNTASTSGSGSLPSNTVANPKGKLKAITTRSGLVLDGPFILMPPRFINPEEDERVEETIRDLEHGEFTIKVPPHLVPKAKPPSQRNYVVRQRDPHHPHIPYPSRMNQEKQKEKDEVQIHKFWQMYMNQSLRFQPKRTLELANREICTPVGIVRDVFVPVGKFTFPTDFVIVDYESDPRVPLILGRPFLRTARALIDVHGEEMILRDVNDDIFDPEGDIIENLHKTKDLPPYHDNPLSGIPTPISETVTKSSSSPTLISFEESDLIWEEFEAYLASDSFPSGNSNPSSLLPPFHNSLSGSTTSSLPSLPIYETSDYSLEEFADELAHFTFPPGIDYLPFDAKSDL